MDKWTSEGRPAWISNSSFWCPPKYQTIHWSRHQQQHPDVTCANFCSGFSGLSHHTDWCPITCRFTFKDRLEDHQKFCKSCPDTLDERRQKEHRTINKPSCSWTKKIYSIHLFKSLICTIALGNFQIPCNFQDNKYQSWRKSQRRKGQWRSLNSEDFFTPSTYSNRHESQVPGNCLLEIMQIGQSAPPRPSAFNILRWTTGQLASIMVPWAFKMPLSTIFFKITLFK